MTDSDSPVPLEAPADPRESLDVESVDKLFHRDPLKWTDQELRAIVIAYQDQRKRWDVEEVQAKQKGKRVQSKKVQLDIKLDDLDLQL